MADANHNDDGVVTDDRIARELAALGESSPDARDLEFVRHRTASGSPDEDVVAVEILFALAHEARPREGGSTSQLSQIERHRTWRRVASRIGLLSRLAGGVTEPARSGLSVWRAVVGSLAVAAAVVLVPRLTLPPVGRVLSDVDVSMVGDQARRGLDALGGPTDGARAHAMAEAYAAELYGSGPARGGGR